jgi:hypothetical protein
MKTTLEIVSGFSLILYHSTHSAIGDSGFASVVKPSSFTQTGAAVDGPAISSFRDVFFVGIWLSD